MIVVVGIPAWAPAPVATESRGSAVGPAVAIAKAAVEAGARVELVGKVGEDPNGDALLIELTRAGIGHVAVLRDPGHPTRVVAAPVAPGLGALAADAATASLLVGGDENAISDSSNGRQGPAPASFDRLALEAADVELALRYLVDFRVIVVSEELPTAALTAIADAASFAEAQLVAVARQSDAGAFRAGATVLEPPAEDPDDDFGRLVGEYAAALDRGEPAEAAFRSLVAQRGWETAG